MIQRHQLTSGTVGLWQFDGGLTDSSGNGYDFALNAGTERYTEIWPGTRSLYLSGSDKYYHNVTGTGLLLSGDMTIEFIINIHADWPNTSAVIVGHGASGESLATNYVYDLVVSAADFRWLQEYGAGANAEYYFPNSFPGQICHVAFTRRSSVVRQYLNGTLRGTSPTLTDPEDGSDGVIWLGDAGSYPPKSAFSSLKILNYGMTDEEVAAEYNSTLGPAFGLV